jgi:hypothetical protein
LEINHDYPEINALVHRRRTNPKEDDMYPPRDAFTRNGYLKTDSNWVQMCRLETGRAGHLTAHLVRDSTRREHPKYWNNLHFGLEDLEKISAAEVAATQAQSVFVECDIAALVCKEARAGDFLLDLASATSSDGIFFIVVRLTGGRDYTVVGQGLMVGDYRMCNRVFDKCDCVNNPSRVPLKARISIQMTAEDAVILFARDFVSPTRFDANTRYGRLRTRVVDKPEVQKPFSLDAFSRNLKTTECIDDILGLA